eukprot:4333835-Pyramimonas_sp.AAC.2
MSFRCPPPSVPPSCLHSFLFFDTWSRSAARATGRPGPRPALLGMGQTERHCEEGEKMRSGVASKQKDSEITRKEGARGPNCRG